MSRHAVERHIGFENQFVNFRFLREPKMRFPFFIGIKDGAKVPFNRSL